MLNYELLRTFVVAASARTFGEAAAERRVSVSAISQQIATLEAQLGVPLFERIGRRAHLTEDGRSLADALRAELARIEDALEAVTMKHRAIRGVVRLGSPRTFGRHWLRPRLPPLISAHPELRFAVELGVPSVLERKLVAGELDLVILVRPSELPGVAVTPLYTETFLAVASPKYLEREGTPKQLAEFRRHRWIVFDPDLAMHGPWWRASFGAKEALPPDVACEIASLEEMLALAEAGAGITVLPDYHVEDSLRAKKIVVLAPAKGQHAKQRAARNTIYLAWRKGAIESARLAVARAALLEGAGDGALKKSSR